MRKLVKKVEEEEKTPLEALHEITDYIHKVIKRYFNNDPYLKEFVDKRIRGARELLIRERVLSELEIGPERRALVLSKQAAEKGLERNVVLRNLSGKVVVLKVGVPWEEGVYSVRVSETRLKCGCKTPN